GREHFVGEYANVLRVVLKLGYVPISIRSSQQVGLGTASKRTYVLNRGDGSVHLIPPCGRLKDRRTSGSCRGGCFLVKARIEDQALAQGRRPGRGSGSTKRGAGGELRNSGIAPSE